MATTVVNKRTHEPCRGDVYIGRPGIWGNPYVMGRDGTRQQVVDRYATMISQQPALLAKVRRELTGRTLVCWCAPYACHGDILRRICDEGLFAVK